MTALISFLIFALLVALVAIVCIWVFDTIIGMMGAPGNISVIAKMIIILIALLLIVSHASPFIGQYV
jgi:hydrogenase-4 membrane subunit HyfE